jgi:hypothetical protein
MGTGHARRGVTCNGHHDPKSNVRVDCHLGNRAALSSVVVEYEALAMNPNILREIAQLMHVQAEPDLFSGQQLQRPGMKTEEDLQRFEKEKGIHQLPDSSANSNLPPTRYQREQAGEAAQMTDQELLDALNKRHAVSPDPDPYTGRRGMRSGEYRGQFLNPDLPNPRDYKLFDKGGDSAFQGFIENFGLERADPASREPDYVPSPRPRYPEQGTPHPLGDTRQSIDEIIEQGANFRPQDIRRLRRERRSWEDNVFRNTGKRPEGNKDGVGLTDEEVLELIQKGLAPKDSLSNRSERRQQRKK